jgi:CheY-like chemotaxis protein
LVVAMTGWGQDEDRRQSKEAGFDQLLVKPLEFATLTELLAQSGPNPGAASKGPEGSVPPGAVAPWEPKKRRVD